MFGLVVHKTEPSTHPFLSTSSHRPYLTVLLLLRTPGVEYVDYADANNGRGINVLASIGGSGGSFGEWGPEMSVAVCVSSTGSIAPGIVSMDDLQRHEGSPITTGVNFTYRSVFEKGLGGEVLVLVFDPEATTPEDGATPLLGGTLVAFTEGDSTEDFTEAAARFMAAIPLALIIGVGMLGLVSALVEGGNAVDAIETQLCELGKRCSGQNF